MITPSDPPALERLSTNCRLCGGHLGEKLAKTPFRRIWISLHEQFGDVFDQEIVERHTPAAQVDLYRCAYCGLDYFSTAVSGDADFYTRLPSSNKPRYYSSEKWDFHDALGLLRPGNSIADVACGKGAWLRLADAEGGESFRDRQQSCGGQ